MLLTYPLSGKRITKLSEISLDLSNALNETRNRIIFDDGHRWISRLEARRCELNSSQTRISYTDFGAIAPDHKFSDKEIANGKVRVTTIGEITQKGSKPFLWCLALFKLVRHFKPRNCLELGTCGGISGAYQSAALKLNGMGSLTTLEGSSSLAFEARRSFEGLLLDNTQVVTGRFKDTLGAVLRQLESVDFVFVDGHHDGPATREYSERIKPYLADQAVVVFDDINWSKSMQRAWKTLTTNKQFDLSVNLATLGICIKNKQLTTTRSFAITLL